MKKSSLLTCIASGMLLAFSNTSADTPALVGKHDHAKQISGKVTMFRTQEKGLEIETGGEKIDAEILVQLDAEPKMVFTLPLHEPDPARKEMIETLRQAYINDTPVTIEHKLAVGKKTAQINWVQLGELALEP